MNFNFHSKRAHWPVPTLFSSGGLVEYSWCSALYYQCKNNYELPVHCIRDLCIIQHCDYNEDVLHEEQLCRFDSGICQHDQIHGPHGVCLENRFSKRKRCECANGWKGEKCEIRIGNSKNEEEAKPPLDIYNVQHLIGRLKIAPNRIFGIEKC